MLPRTVTLLCALSLLAACSSDDSNEKESPSEKDSGSGDPDSGDVPDAAPAALVLESSAFEEGGTLPPVHRCANAPSPPFAWSGGPSAESYAIVMKDLDAGLLHWIIYDIPGSTTELPEGVPSGAELSSPAGAKQPNIIGTGYFGPCSLTTTNTYQFTLHAVDAPALPELTVGSAAPDVVAAIEQHSLESAALSVESGP
jgi:Raf kinase inhibitor-like YbhB/YbcL family protein